MELKREHDQLKNKLQKSKNMDKIEKEMLKARNQEIYEYLESPLEIRFVDTMAFLNSSFDKLLKNSQRELRCVGARRAHQGSCICSAIVYACGMRAHPGRGRAESHGRATVLHR